MKKLSTCGFACLLAAHVLFTVKAQAQNWTSVTAANITDLNQQKLAAGQLCFLATDQSDNPISIGIGGGGQLLRRTFCTTVTNGAVTAFSVPNPALTAPAGVLYRVTVNDSSAGKEVLRYTQVGFSGATFNFDNYAPTSAGPLIPLGNSVTGNLSVSGNVTATGAVNGSNIPAGQIVSGSGTTNKLAKFTTGASGIVGDSGISDSGTTISTTESISAPSLTGLTGALTPNAAGGIDVGSAALPFSGIDIGNAATNNIRLTGTATAARTATLPNNTGILAESNLAQTWSAAQTFNDSTLLLAGATSGSTTLKASATASGVLTLPATTDTLVGKATTDIFSGKTIDTASANTLKINGATLNGIPSVMQFSCTGTAASATTLSLSGGPCTNTAAIQFPVSSAATIANLRCRPQTAGVNVSSGVVTVRKNAAAQTLTCTIGTSATGCSDVTHSFSAVAGDLIDVIVSTQASETLANIGCTVEKQ